jgi:hypothetical protein
MASDVREATRPRLKLWHLAVLVAFVAVAITQIQAQRRTEPVLIALAAAGFAGYALIGVGAWRVKWVVEKKYGRLEAFVLFLAFMAGLFFVATLIYLVIEQRYLGVGFW